MTVPVLDLQHVSKRFGAIDVLVDVSLALWPGRVHALAGENGAGKSTLVKIIGGVHQPNAGQILKEGQPLKLLSPLESRRQGIAVVHQHPALFPDLTVAENVFIGHQPRRNGRIDWRYMNARARELLAQLDVAFDVDTPVKHLGVSERQAIEVARALAIDARVLVLDEPTSALSGTEVIRLFDLVGRLKQRGVAVLFVTHFLDEIMKFSDDVTVLRSGRHVVTSPTETFTPETIVRAMIGTKLESFFPKQEAEIGKPVLSVRGLSGAGFVTDVDFEVRTGEILGFFGLVGAGRSEIASMLFGIIRPDAGTITLGGEQIELRSPRQAIREGISLVPEDRHKQGLVLPFSIRANETLPMLGALSGLLGRIDGAREETVARDYAQRMRVVASSVEQAAGTLSGGNQQKVLLAKWLMPTPRLLILDEPTRGIDVGAKSEIHRAISQLATTGMSIIMISDDAEELIGMADRILVFRGGRITASFDRGTFDREKILLAAAHEVLIGASGKKASTG
ncbi:sugar ABC transporter ATP-binding protein [Labrys okinawensis]|uniref:sugar ABC transporter ATP-binding protein n=1 Tax=Labrys okinawensis TaxID=346911 RepID=UPI0039BC2540